MRPLVVDLDGTLILTDMLHESALRLLRDHPFDVFKFPRWLTRGKALFKREVADRADIRFDLLPYNQPLIEWLQEEKAKGRKLILCTASDKKIAHAISDHLGIFDEVIASDGEHNIEGEMKADVLEKRFGNNEFDYAGNSTADLAVWKKAHSAIVVNAAPAILSRVQSTGKVERVFPAQTITIPQFVRMLRLHQWLKNLLLFATCFAAHRIGQLHDWVQLILAFLAFGLSASSIYIVNDLLDIDSDRAHPRKRKRPIASGEIPISQAAGLIPILFFSGLLIGLVTSHVFLNWLMVYIIITALYSFKLKRIVLIDCIILALLYTIRVIAGAAAISSPISFWLLALSIFLFLSLAFVKRSTELQIQIDAQEEKTYGRGYYTTDAPLIQIFGVASAFAAVVVLALYINSDAVQILYKTHEIIWLTVPVLLFWISWIWLKVQRREMDDDPVIFALKNKTSLLCGFVFLSIFAIGTMW